MRVVKCRQTRLHGRRLRNRKACVRCNQSLHTAELRGDTPHAYDLGPLCLHSGAGEEVKVLICVRAYHSAQVECAEAAGLPHRALILLAMCSCWRRRLQSDNRRRGSCRHSYLPGFFPLSALVTPLGPPGPGFYALIWMRFTRAPPECSLCVKVSPVMYVNVWEGSGVLRVTYLCM